jgi:hypothetical protein
MPQIPGEHASHHSLSCAGRRWRARLAGAFSFRRVRMPGPDGGIMHAEMEWADGRDHARGGSRK